MSIKMTDKVNDTIPKMAKNLNPSADVELDHFSFGSNLKRSCSSLSNDSQCSTEEFQKVKKAKYDKQLDLAYVGSPQELRRLRIDLLEGRNTVLTLEGRIQHMQNVKTEMELVYQNENKLLKNQHENDTKSIENLESQLQSIRQREADLKSQLAEANCKYTLLKVKKDEEIRELDKSLSEIKEESRLYDAEENAEITTLNRKLGKVQILLDTAEEDADAQKKLVLELEKRLSEKSAIERDLEKRDNALQLAVIRIKDLEYAKENFLEFQDQAKSQVQKLANYIELEKEVERLKDENTRLKDGVTNKLILEEEVHDLKSRLSHYKEQEKNYATLRAEQAQTEMYINEWRSVTRGICETTGSDSSLPHILRSAVERLQQQEITLTSTKVELESELTTAVYEKKIAKIEFEKSQKLLTEMKKTSEQKQNLFHRMQKKLLLVCRERDSYRLQLDSYEKDLTMSINPSSNANAIQLQPLRERIDALEKIVDSYRELNAKLETDLQNCNPSLYSDSSTNQAEQIVKLQDEVEQLKLEKEMLSKKRDQIEIQLENFLVGHDTLQGSQVSHLENNPSLANCLAESKQVVEKLEQEVERLKKKIRSLKDELEASKLSDSVNPKEIETLKEQIKEQESQSQRLKDYFRSSLQEFRNVIYMLLGYKIDRSSTSLYKLTSAYSESAEDQLCFQLNEEGHLNLLENDFSLALEHMVNLHLHHQKSIPVFLSALTMDLFNSCPVSTRTREME